MQEARRIKFGSFKNLWLSHLCRIFNLYRGIGTMKERCHLEIGRTVFPGGDKILARRDLGGDKSTDSLVYRLGGTNF